MSLPEWPLLSLVAIVSFCSNWQFAFQTAYVNTAVDVFFKLSEHAYERECTNCTLSDELWAWQWSLIVSAVYPGSILGFLMIPLLVRNFGVKHAMLSTCFSALVGCFVHFVVGSATLVWSLVVGRFLIGLQAGSSLCLLPLYVREFDLCNFRNGLKQIAQALGTLIGLLVGDPEVLPLGGFRFVFLQLIAVTPTVLFVMVLALTPATPRQLLHDGVALSRVLRSLHFYQGKKGRLDEIEQDTTEMTEITRCLKNRKLRHESSLAWKGFAIGSLAALSYSFTADDLIDTYSLEMIDEASGVNATGHVDAYAENVTIMLGVVLVVASVGGTFLIERFGHRRVLLLGLLGTAISNLVVVLARHSTIIVTIAFTFTKVCIGAGAGAPAWFLTSELVPSSWAPLFQSLSTGILLTSTMLLTLFYLPIASVVGLYALMLLAVVPASICALLLFLFLPETKDRCRADVERQLSSRIFSGMPVFGRVAPAVYGSI